MNTNYKSEQKTEENSKNLKSNKLLEYPIESVVNPTKFDQC